MAKVTDERVLEVVRSAHSGIMASKLADTVGVSAAWIYTYLNRLKRDGKVMLYGRRWYRTPDSAGNDRD